MENFKFKLSASSVVPVHENDDDDHTNLVSSSSIDNGGAGSDREPENMNVQDPISETDDDDEDEDDDDNQEEEEESDNESCTSCVSPKRFEFFSANGLVELDESEKDYKMIIEKFFTGLGDLAQDVSVVAIQKNLFLGPFGQARMESFQIFSQAMARKCEGNANIKFAWYGNSKDGISEILSHGFGKCEKPMDCEKYGLGIYLTPQNSSIDRVMSSPMDENGLRHVLLCRVILGNLEKVLPGSEQFHPTSDEFDSGVDDLFFPKKYIVWSTNMNTHILPEFVISFRAPFSLEGYQWSPAKKPKSAWMPFATLIIALSRCLHPAKIGILKKHHIAFRERKISRVQLIQVTRQTAGDNLLATVIKSFRSKDGSEASTSGS